MSSGTPPSAPPPLVASGSLFALIFFGLLASGTNDRSYTTVRRTFVGGRLAICLLIVFAAVTALGVTLAQKDPKMEPVEMLCGVLIVWIPASAIHLFLFHIAARLPTSPTADAGDLMADEV